MSEWPLATVGDHVRRQSERVLVETGVDHKTMGLRWYGRGAYLRPPSRPQTRTLGVARDGDFVFCRIDTQNGPFAVVSGDLDGALVTNEFPLYSVDPVTLSAEFLALCFARPSALERIGKLREGRDGRARWKEADFEGWSIPLPSPETQARIVEVLSAVDVTIDALRAEAAASQTARAALLDRLIFDLGDDFTETSLKEVAEWSSGGTPKADNPAYYSGEIPWAIIGDVKGRVISETTRSITAAGLKKIGGESKIAPAGSVLITMYGTIGRCALAGVPMATNQAICRGVPNGRVTADYLRLWVAARQADLVALGDGKTQQNISKAKVESFRIKFHSPLVQEQIVDIMTTVEYQAESLERELGRALNARSALLEGLLSRQVELV